MATRPLCSVDGCGKPWRTKGLCGSHYLRLHRGADVDAPMIYRGGRMAWIREHVTYVGDDCLIWPFRKHKSGGGSVFFEGRYQMVSRVMCLLAHGEPPTPDLYALHSCGNGHLACANRNHLRWGTQYENMQDAIGHGTTTRGEKNAQATLTADDVRRIRSMKGSATYKEIAPMFGITKSAVGLIMRGERWGWLK